MPVALEVAFQLSRCSHRFVVAGASGFRVPLEAYTLEAPEIHAGALAGFFLWHFNKVTKTMPIMLC